jgi:hypothetical protein
MNIAVRLLGGIPLAVAALQASSVSFNRDIRPIMSATCFRCHGPDKSSRMAGLRLDLRDEALKPLSDGSAPIVPGDPDRSRIVQRIFAANAANRMPPQYAHKDLTDKQKQTIRQWVAEGAVYEGHWAYQPIQRPVVPQLSRKAPVVNPIDNYIQDRLAKEGLAPSPEADRRTLLRRVSLDLTGLPPTPAEVRAFENDHSPDAYEKQVDRLLASPRYAEQQTMHWLDAVRYADTCGFHGDNIFPAWPYRDYVLNAFRDDMPFDRFTREQLAGDLLPNATPDQKVASAYNRLNRTSAEGGIQPKEYLAKYGGDRVRAVSVAWLGSTMGCAECHDHKFDPFKSKDFYSMKAFFADVEETGLVPDRGEKAWGAKLELPAPEQKHQRDQLDAKIADLRKQLAAVAGPTPEQENAIAAKWKNGELAWHFQRPESATSMHGAVLSIYNDKPVDSLIYIQDANGASLNPDRHPGNGLIILSGPNPDNETYMIVLRPGAGSWTELGIDIVGDESLPGNRISRGADRFLLTGVEATLQAPGGPARKLTFAAAKSDKTADNGMPADAAIDNDPETGWGAALGDSSDPFLALRFTEKITTTADSRIVVALRHDSTAYRRATIGRFRLALASGEYAWPAEGTAVKRVKNRDADAEGAKTWASGLPPEMRTALDAASAQRKPDENTAIREYFEWTAPEAAALRVELDKLEGQRSILNSQIPRVVTSVAVKPQETRILPRGNWMDETGEIVEPAVPEFLSKPNTGGRRATRLDLANWLASEDNPLTARVFVNRQWRQLFGTGISKSVDDLGSQGEWPIHPELLDWLAAEFKHPAWNAQGAHDWDVKHLIRTIVLSHTYRQSSLPVPQIDAKDPENRLLARQSRFRVDAENVRDIMLQISGLLQIRFGGPSVKPYQPDGYLATLNFPKREYSASRGADLYRRGVYTLWQRTFLNPSLLNFDAPTREECTVNRVLSNTPLQALDLLNDPIYVEAARVFATNAVTQAGAYFDRQLNWIFGQALNRAPTAEERAILAGVYRDNLKRFSASPDDARKFTGIGDTPPPSKLNLAQVAAAAAVTRVVLNLHETITRN